EVRGGRPVAREQLDLLGQRGEPAGPGVGVLEVAPDGARGGQPSGDLGRGQPVAAFDVGGHRDVHGRRYPRHRREHLVRRRLLVVVVAEGGGDGGARGGDG